MTGQTFRFPTEAEWEYAARGARDTISYKYAGDSISTNVAWSMENSGGATHMVALKDPNQLGLYDMSGNVCEWCQDWYDNYSSSPQINPTGPAYSTQRVLRGGSCFEEEGNYHHVSGRSKCIPQIYSNKTGFRLVLAVDDEFAE